MVLVPSGGRWWACTRPIRFMPRVQDHLDRWSNSGIQHIAIASAASSNKRSQVKHQNIYRYNGGTFAVKRLKYHDKQMISMQNYIENVARHTPGALDVCIVIMLRHIHSHPARFIHTAAVRWQSSSAQKPRLRESYGIDGWICRGLYLGVRASSFVKPALTDVSATLHRLFLRRRFFQIHLVRDLLLLKELEPLLPQYGSVVVCRGISVYLYQSLIWMPTDVLDSPLPLANKLVKSWGTTLLLADVFIRVVCSYANISFQSVN